MLRAVALFLAALLVFAPPTNAADILEIHEAEGDVALIFFHGLGGHPLCTFSTATDATCTYPVAEDDDTVSWFDLIRNDETSLPWIADGSAARLSIHTVDYRDAFEADLSISEISKQIDRRTDFQRIFKRYNHVWLVGHSLGGLVIKQIFVESHEYRRKRIVGVSLLGVPNNGAGLADLVTQLDRWPFGRSLGEVFTRWLGVDWTQMENLRTVERGNYFLDEMQTDWHRVVNERRDEGARLRVGCAFESKPEVESWGWSVKVVDKLYSRTTCDVFDDLAFKHSQLTKPTTPDDDRHDWLRRELIEGLRALEHATTVRFYRSRERRLGAFLERMIAAGSYTDSGSGLKLVPERLAGIDARNLSEMDAPKLWLDGRNYEGFTYGAVLRQMAEHNDCLEVTTDGRRRNYSLELVDAASCPDGVSFACDPADCGSVR